MDNFIVKKIDEHKAITKRINKLSSIISAIETDQVKGDSKISPKEYALMHVQLEYMIGYHDTLTSILNLHDVVIAEDQYYVNVTNPIITPPEYSGGPGSDFDIDNPKNND